MSLHCPECGHDVPSTDAYEAQARIADLETQVRLLNSKASSYINKLTDYEDEIRSLRAECARLQSGKEQSTSIRASSPPPKPFKEDVGIPTPPPSDKDSRSRKAAKRPSLARLSSLASYLPMRRQDDNDIPPVPPLDPSFNQSSPNLMTPPNEYLRAPTSPPFATDPGRQGQSVTLIGLQTSLETERHLRQQAESSLAQSQTELEELTAQLFGQANEMVAAERKARAKLEERVKLLETRDGEKRRRLERLEKAVDRIERVRRIVVDHEKEMGEEAYTQTDVGQIHGRKIMRHTRRSRSRRRNGDIGRSRGRGWPEIVDEEEEDDSAKRISLLEDYEDVGSRTYEFDVRLKVWRRSRANIWRTPTFD